VRLTCLHGALLTLSLPTHADGSHVGGVFSGVCVSVCLSVGLSPFPLDISKTDSTGVTKLDIGMVHHESMETHKEEEDFMRSVAWEITPLWCFEPARIKPN